MAWLRNLGSAFAIVGDWSLAHAGAAQTYSPAIQAVAAVAQVLVTVALGLFVYRATRRIARAEYTREIQHLNNVVNTTALSSVENLAASTALSSLNRVGRTEGEQRRLWLTFLRLNAFQAQYLGCKDKLLDRQYGRESLDQILDLMLTDPVAWYLIHNRGYDRKFVAYCDRRWRKCWADRAPPELPVEPVGRSRPAAAVPTVSDRCRDAAVAAGTAVATAAVAAVVERAGELFRQWHRRR